MATTSPEAVVQAFYKAFNNGDIETILSLYEARAILVAQPDQLADGLAALGEALRGVLAMKATLTLEKHKVVTSDDIALSVGKWTLKGTGPDGQPVHMEGTASEVLRKQSDGRWLYVIDNPWGAGILG